MSGPVGFEAWAELAGDSPTSRTEWAALVAAWSEPHRRYHDLAHLAAVLGLVGELGAGDLTAVRLAAWYHDVVYDPERADNEEISAQRARAGLRGLVDDDRVAEVERLVRLTAGHDPAPDDVDGAVLCDADLAASLAHKGRSTILARHTCAHRVDELLAIERELAGRSEAVA